MFNLIARLLSFVVALLLVLPDAGAQTAKRGYVVLPPLDDGDKRPITLYKKSYALIIGIDKYTHGWPPLGEAQNDARAVAKELKQHGFAVDLHLNLKSRQLKQVLEDFIYEKGQHAEARLFIWFAGHGHTIKGGSIEDEGYLVPADAPLPDRETWKFKRNALSLRRFGEYMREARAKHVMTVFDSCFSGTVFSAARALPPSVISLATTQRVRQFVSSGEAKQEVSDDGTFRKLFIDALKGKDARADMNRDGFLLGSELGLFLHQEVTNLTSNQQTPRYGKLRARGYNRGDFVFRVGKPVSPPQSVGDSQGASATNNKLFAMRKRLAALEAEQKKWQRRKKAASSEPKSSSNSEAVGQRKVAVGVFPKKQPRRRQNFEPEVVHIPGGTFSMGCVSGRGCNDEEKPVHRVTVGSFYLAKYETTFAQWDACVADGGCKHKPKDEGWGRGNRPVINVSWNDAVFYAKWLSRKTVQTWRLPTEAEWEYAARGDENGKNRTKFHFGNSEADLCKYGNHADKSVDYSWKNKKCSDGVGKKTARVGSYKPNGFGVYDMHGNVWEWVHDWKRKYKMGHQTDPKGPASGSGRVVRGGSWFYYAGGLRSADRNLFSPGSRLNFLGFRVLRQVSDTKTQNTNTCVTIGRKIPSPIKLSVGAHFCDAARKNKARVIKIANRAVVFLDNGVKKTCAQGALCAFDWPVKPLFRIKARADKAKGIAPQATMEPRR